MLNPHDLETSSGQDGSSPPSSILCFCCSSEQRRGTGYQTIGEIPEGHQTNSGSFFTDDHNVLFLSCQITKIGKLYTFWMRFPTRWCVGVCGIKRYVIGERAKKCHGVPLLSGFFLSPDSMCSSQEKEIFFLYWNKIFLTYFQDEKSQMFSVYALLQLVSLYFSLNCCMETLKDVSSFFAKLRNKPTHSDGVFCFTLQAQVIWFRVVWLLIMLQNLSPKQHLHSNDINHYLGFVSLIPVSTAQEARTETPKPVGCVLTITTRWVTSWGQPTLVILGSTDDFVTITG